MKKYTWVILVSLFSCAISTTVFAAANAASVEDRLNRLERLVNSKGLVDVMVRVENLQSELQRLVGEIELQKHTLDEIKKRQRDLYLDIDRRILQIERRSGSSSTATMSTTPQSSVRVTAEPVVNSTPAPRQVSPVAVLVRKRQKKVSRLLIRKLLICCALYDTKKRRKLFVSS